MIGFILYGSVISYYKEKKQNTESGVVRVKKINKMTYKP